MAKTGRPSTYDPAVATKICEQLSEGISLREICRQDGMPPWQTVYSWMERDASLVEAIARAREIGYDALAEECLKIADDGTNDYVEGERGPQLNSEHIQRSKLRIETRLKLLAKWNPKKYGERVQVAGDADSPLKVEAEVQADKLLQAILANAQMTRQADGE
jgi:hypothetical protein